MTDTTESDTSGRNNSTPANSDPHWVILALLWCAGLGAAGLACIALAAGICLAVIYPNLPAIDGLGDYRPKIPLRVYSADNQLIGEFGDERRNFLPINEIPKVMQNAVLAIEDSRFYEHGGGDYLGVLRAGLANFVSIGSQGASTITMQVARNFYLSTEKTMTRKIYEILLALKIESKLSKDQILELYMNQIYLGQRAYGFAAACETYFGKPIAKITTAEAAMLAGLPKAPSAYNPVRNLKRATIRQQYILDRMLANDMLSQQEYAQAKAEQLILRPRAPISKDAAYVAETARGLMFNRYGADAYSRGLRVYTSIHMKDQTAATQALRKGLLTFDGRQAWRGPEGYVDLPTDPKEIDVRVAEALEDYVDSDDLHPAVVLSISDKRVVALLQTGESIDLTGAALHVVRNALQSSTPVHLQVRRGAVIRVSKGTTSKGWKITQMPQVQGALVAIDPETGEIRALVGGFDFNKSPFNHVTQAWRQPGSSFKPFIYSAALEKGFTPTTIVNDAPLSFDGRLTGGQPWVPKNYDGRFEGLMTLKRGLAKSKNMVSIRVLESIGTGYAQDWITRFGFDAEKHPPYLTMALGAGSVTPMQMASAYSVFANGGYRLNPSLVTKVVDARNRVLMQSHPKPNNESMRAIDARNAFVMSNLLQEVARSGTAARAQATLKRPDLYGKTGTTNDAMDAWFAGYSPTMVAVVWIGYDTPRKLGDKETGGGLALPVWIDFMQTAIAGTPVQTAMPPEGMLNIGGEWYYEEFTPATSIRALRQPQHDYVAPQSVGEEEKRSILELFSDKQSNEFTQPFGMPLPHR